MIHLRTLGALSLTRDDGREVQSVLAQPKRVALLAYLASPATPAFTGRETLLGLFWPDLDQDRARSALRTSLHFLRRSLGGETIISRGEHEAGVDPERLECDAVVFEAKLAAGDTDAGLELYGGEYLPGLTIDDALEFERWLEGERRRLQRRARDAARGAAEAAARRREHRQAEQWARRALTLDPWDEEALRLLMGVLSAEGNRAEALVAYELFARRLQQELELEPSSETRALAAQLREGSASSDEPGRKAEAPSDFVRTEEAQTFPSDAPVRAVRRDADRAVSAMQPEGTAGAVASGAARSLDAPAKQRRARFVTRRRAAWVGAGLAIVASGALVASFVLRRSPRMPDGMASDLAILPFAVVGEDSALGTEVAQMVALNLRDVPKLTLAPPRFTFRWWRAEERSAGVTDPSKLPVRDALHVRFYVTGDLLPDGDSLEARVTVLGAEGMSLPKIVVKAVPGDEIGLGDAIALQVLRSVHPELASTYSGSFLRTRSVQAVEEFLRGEDAFQRNAWRSAERHYLAALHFDSTFALVWWRLDDVGRWLSRQQPYQGMDLPRLLREHGSELGTMDSLLLDAQLTSLADGRIDRYEQVTRRFPHDGYAALLYGNEILHRGPLVGRSEKEALEVAEDAAARDTFQAPAYDHLGWLAIRLGQRDLARRALQRLHHIAAPGTEVLVDFGRLLDIAYQVRFDGTSDSLALSTAHLPPAQVAYAARVGNWTGLPHIQLTLGAFLSRSTEPERRAEGHEARALALLALGGGAGAVAQADSAAGLFRTRASEIEAAEWRVVPAALGWPLTSAAQTDLGRQRLSKLAVDPAVGARAAWALSLDALARGDTAALQRWSSWLAERADSGALRLRQLIEAAQSGYGGDASDALRLSEPLLRYDESGRGGDPFARAALHLLRGTWRQSLGDRDGAEREWRWANNLDVIRWPMEGEAQAADVDWVFAVPAAWLRGNLAMTRADTATACSTEAWVDRFWDRAGGWPQDSAAELHRVIGAACGV